MIFKDYFSSHDGYFWQWEVDDQVVGIPGGVTIGYHGLLLELLESLAANGLPSFGGFLLTVAATNPTRKEAMNQVASILFNLNFQKNSANHSEIRVDIHAALNFLNVVSDLPEEVLTKRKAALLATFFDRVHNKINAKTSVGLISKAKQARERFGKTGTTSLRSIAPPGEQIFINDFRPLALLWKTFPTKEHILAALDNLPEPTSPEIPPSEATVEAGLMEQLLDDNVCFPAAALVKTFWSGFHLPAHQAFISQQALGGLADITNKGQVDKMLVSEYANDDLLLLSRLANNEVLYLQKEAPPRADHLQRIVLIDGSIKNWGTPRIIAFGILLSLYKHPKNLVRISGFKAAHNYVPVDLESAASVRESMLDLDSCLDPADGLASFISEHKQKTTTETIFITSSDGLRSEPVQRLLYENPSAIDYIVATEANGNVELFRNSIKGRVSLQVLEVPLKKLWEKPSKEKSGKEKTSVVDQPGGFASPLLFPNPRGKFKVLILSSDSDSHEAFVVDRKKLYSVFKHEDRPVGMLEIAVNIAPGFILFAIGKNSDDELLLMAVHPGKQQAVFTNLETNKQTELFLDSWKPHLNESFFFSEGKFYYPMRYQCLVIDPEKLSASTHGVGFSGSPLADVYNETQEIRSKVEKQCTNSHAILRNLKTVSITNEHVLKINNHLLQETNNSLILSTSGYSGSLLTANSDGSNRFSFGDGSAIILHEGGQVQLRSANASIPSIYICTLLDTPTAAATASAFSGNKQYRPGNKKQEHMKPKEFYDLYINRFVEEILMQCR